MPVNCLVVTSRSSRDRKRDFQLQTTQMHEASCLFSCKSILLRTSGKCQSLKRTACMLNFIYIVQSKWYLRFKISVQGPFKWQPFPVLVRWLVLGTASAIVYVYSWTWSTDSVVVCSLLCGGVSPWYNPHGWLGIHNELYIILLLPQCAWHGCHP